MPFDGPFDGPTGPLSAPLPAPVSFDQPGRQQEAFGPGGFDPESTAAWSLQEDDHQPHAAHQPPAHHSTGGWSTPESFEQQEPSSGGPGPIVPDDWFADSQHSGPQAGAPWDMHQPGPEAWNEGNANSTMVMGGGGGPGAQLGPMGPGGPATVNMGGTGGFGQQELLQGPGPGYGTPPHGPYGNEFQQDGGFPPNGGFQQGDGFQSGGGFPHGSGPYGAQGTQGGGKRQNKTLILVVGGLVAAAVVAVSVVMLSGGGGGSSGGSTSPVAEKSGKAKGVRASAGHEQATAVNAILDESLRSRSQLNDALTAAKKCSGLDTAISTMQQVATDRQGQIDRTKALDVDKLSKGPELRDALGKAISASLDVDKAFLSWAQASRGCHGHPKANADERHGQQLSDDATSAKRDFAKLWDPVAVKEGFTKRGTYF